jgi:hypothetical protein
MVAAEGAEDFATDSTARLRAVGSRSLAKELSAPKKAAVKPRTTAMRLIFVPPWRDSGTHRMDTRYARKLATCVQILTEPGHILTYGGFPPPGGIIGASVP